MPINVLTLAITDSAAIYNLHSRIIPTYTNELNQKSFNHQKYLLLVIFQPPQRLHCGLNNIHKYMPCYIIELYISLITSHLLKSTHKLI